MRTFVVLALAIAGTGCGAFSSEAGRAVVPAMVELARASVPYLRDLAKRKGVEIDESLAVCLPISEVLETSLEVELPAVAVMCIAPEPGALDWEPEQ